MSFQDFIDNFLSQVLEDFKKRIAQMDSICFLETLNYENMRTPDYSNVIMREYYLLRYFYAYLAEYSQIYRSMIGKNYLTPPLSVASIGCGAGIDYYALRFVVPPSFKDFTYQGFDLIDWGFPENNSRTVFLQANISELNLENINVLIFPKSLSEFSDKDFEAFLVNLNPRKFQDHICIVSSIMNVGGEHDIKRIQLLEEKFCQFGYKSLNDSNETYTPTAESCYHVIGARCPDYVTEYLSQLKALCEQTAPGCPNCQINKSPILRTEYMRFQTLFLVR